MATPSDAGPPPRTFRMRRIDRLNDALFRGLARLGVGPAWSLITRGRKTGQLRTTPVIPVSEGGRRWLVAPYGEVSWVHNARAAGEVQLSRGRTRRTYTVRQVSAKEAGPVLQRYVRIASATRPYFAAPVDAPVAAFIAEADRHPVFELTPVTDDPAAASRDETG
jgi:deazaflavin-dependent oxidoreductase (nitroreductase family)